MKLTALVSTIASLLASVLAAGEGVNLSKEFIDDPVPPGAEVTLRFYFIAAGAVSDLSFSDDLDAALSGLVATGLPVNDVCGPGSVLSGTSVITLTGGNGRACNFDVTLMVPAGAAEGDYLNTTSLATGSIDGSPVEGGPAQDTLRVEFIDRIVLEKRFLDDPALPGDQVTLEFTLTSLNEGEAATAIAFSDDLEAALPGLSAVGLPQSDVCGPGSQLSGDAMVTLSNGSLAPAADCTFSATVQIPFSATKGAHLNTTSTVEASFSGSEGGGDAASDYLHVGRCVEADRGDGTTMMPPASCSYVWSMKKESLTFLPTSGIEISARVHQYDCLQPGCEVPGGTLAGTQHEFNAVVTLDIVGTGDLEGFRRTIDLVSAPPVEINSAPRTPGDPV
ncbi:MAG: hypothetical protein P8Y44_03330, partial [Acidobacteriota bacterium]